MGLFPEIRVSVGRRLPDESRRSPVVQIPRLPVNTRSILLGSRANALIVTASTPAQNEDFLLPIELVDCCANKKGVHSIGDGDYINSWKGDHGSASKVIAEITIDVTSVHQDIVGCCEAFDGAHYDLPENFTQVGSFIEGVIQANRQIR